MEGRSEPMTPPALLFRDARVVDGIADEPFEAAVLVVDGRVAEIGAPGMRAPDLSDLRVIALEGRTLMPGLIDVHVHPTATEVIEDFQRPVPTTLRSLVARTHLEAMLRRGFTTVRDAGGCDIGLRLATDRGLIDGPRLFVAGKALSQTGGHGDERAVTDGDPTEGAYPGEFARIADGLDAVRLAARQELRRGADQIKICASGGVMSATDPVDMTQYSEAEIRAIVEEAASRQTYVMAHAYGADAIARAVRCGVRSIEHGNLIDAEAAAVVVAHEAFVVPTMVTYEGLDRHGRAAGVDDARLAKNDEVRRAGLGAFAHPPRGRCTRRFRHRPARFAPRDAAARVQHPRRRSSRRRISCDRRPPSTRTSSDVPTSGGSRSVRPPTSSSWTATR